MKAVAGIVTALILLWSAPLLADDTDIYGVSTVDVPPNVLIIFDNSGSMDEQDVPDESYNPATTYDGSYPANAVYRKRKNNWELFANDVNDLNCASIKNVLKTDGYGNGGIESGPSYNCGGKNKQLRLGNYLNYLSLDLGGYRKRIDVAKEVITDLLNDKGDELRFGAMIFNYSEGGRILEPIGTDKTTLINSINDLSPATWTPLAETLAEAGLYFAGKRSWFNSGNYTSPMQERCQKNYIILMTDGEPTEDRNWRLETETYINGDPIGDYDGDTNESAYPADKEDDSVSQSGPYDTSDYLDDVAKYLYDNDLNSSLGNPGNLEKQNVTTFTIGFQTDQTLLDATAANGGGAYYVSNNISSLKEAFESIISQISAENSMFVAPVVPVSILSGTYAGNRIYIGFFKPHESGRWVGNIKKYGLGGDGELLDADNVAATDATGKILDTAISYWSINADGPNVDAGGAGGVLLNQADRNIYTYQGTQIFLTDADNAFENSNTEITNTELDVGTDTERQALFDDIHGLDREWILGDFIHSKPAVVHYSDKTVIFAGSNDGMLHAFDDIDGSELWAFIPPDQLNELKLLSDAVTMHDYFVDGAPAIYRGSAQKILIIGERRGGSNYTALDITDYNSPNWLYTIEPSHLGTEIPLGQSWVTPQAATLQKDASTTEDVFLLAGGYDTNQDLETPTATDSVGRAVFSVNVSTGVLSSLNFHHGNFSDMTHSIVSLSGVDHDNDGITSRLYAGDLGGNMFAFKDDEDDENNPGNPVTDGTWSKRRLFSASADGFQRKIQYAPDVVKEKFGETIFFGTGDRADSYETGVVNRIYAVKNNWGDDAADTNLTESDLVNVTDNLIQLGTAIQKEAVQTALDEKKGWFIELENLGEKVVSTPVVFGGVVYFTTYTPGPAGGAIDPNDPCSGTTATGVGRLYAVDYKTGGSAHNWTTAEEIDQETGDPTDLGKADRTKIVGYSMPSPPVIAILETGPKLYIGIEGGVDDVDPIPAPDLNIIYWRQLTN
ncbi:MAG: PilC/PilY family type IV pilus protein [Desulfobacterales bacterium]